MESEMKCDNKKEFYPYGKCPKCDSKGVNRERRLNGNDRCVNGHAYPSKSAVN